MNIAARLASFLAFACFAGQLEYNMLSPFEIHSVSPFLNIGLGPKNYITSVVCTREIWICVSQTDISHAIWQISFDAEKRSGKGNGAPLIQDGNPYWMLPDYHYVQMG